MTYADVILPVPVEGYFTYAVPSSIVRSVKAGVRVVVPFGKTKTYVAVVARVHDVKPEFEVKDVFSVVDDKPVLLTEQLRLWQWISHYYMSPIGDVMKAALPLGLKAEGGYRPKMEQCIELAPSLREPQTLQCSVDALRRAPAQQKVLKAFFDLKKDDDGIGATRVVTREELMNASHCTAATLRTLIDRKMFMTYEREVGRVNREVGEATGKPRPLSSAQQKAFDEIVGQTKSVTLLKGVTSSGKTEIYIHLIERMIGEGRQVLYLLPEIALTVQITERLRHVFGNRMAIYHSKYSDAERVEIWQRQLSDRPFDIILGARSAVFVPFQRLGLVIVDEEHETSFKQQDPAPRYHARSVAIMLAHMYGARTLLGTATPSLESYSNAMTGKYGLVELNERYKGIELPEVQIVDVKDLRRRKMMTGPLSPPLLAAIRATLKAGEQAILFQNRRGYAPHIECRDCGWIPRCENCDVSLTYHMATNTLTCHYCGYTCHVPMECPNCGGHDIVGRGYGTENIEGRVMEEFPEARVARLDLDSTHTLSAYSRIIDDFSRGNTDILIGTQMVTKGLDFDRVRLVGILDADNMLSYPDFRAYEHAFTMMQQVSGRAGRKGRRGVVMLQTRNPDMSLIRQVVQSDYQDFFSSQMEERRVFGYPPYTHLVYVYMRHKYEQVVSRAAEQMTSWLRQSELGQVLGPDKPVVARVKSKYIRKIMIKLANSCGVNSTRHTLHSVAHALLANKQYATVELYYDVDPV